MRTLPVFHENKWAQWLGYTLVVAFLLFPDLFIAQAPVRSSTVVIDPEQKVVAERVGGFMLEPIRYEIGPPVEEGVHAYLSFDVEGGEAVQFLNAQLVGSGVSEGHWVLRNVPLLPHASKQRISCTVNMEEMGGVESAYNLAYHVGGEPVSGPTFPPVGGFVGLTPQTAVHRVFSGSDDPPVAIELPAPGASTLLIFPRIPKIEFVFRGCDVPNIDLNLKDCDEEKTGIPCDTLACGPASAANSLQWLKTQHAELAGDKTSLRYKTDRLKELMKLNKHGVKGVRFDSMVIGKLTLIDELKLPIHVKYNTKHVSGNEKELVSDNPDYDHKADNEGMMDVHPPFDWLKKEMEAGEDVEVQLGWYGPLEKGEDGKMKRKRHYGHWLVASGYFQMGDLKGMYLKDDDDQLDTGGLRHKYYPWDTLPGGVPYLKALTDAKGNVAIVESFVSESYDPTVEFKDPVSVRPDPWDELDLFHERMKPGYPFGGVKDKRGFPWLPVILGVTGGGVLTWLLVDGQGDGKDPVCELMVSPEITHATCGRFDGAIEVMAQGADDVTFQWFNGRSSPRVEGLLAGMYGVVVRWDGGRCKRMEELTVEDHHVSYDLEIVTERRPDCGDQNGSIRVIGTPEGNYSYEWSNGLKGSVLSGIGAGTYEVTATLGANCMEEEVVNVESLDPKISMDVTTLFGNCLGGGAISVYVRPYRFLDTLVLILEGNGINEEWRLGIGRYELGDFVNIYPGTYTLTLYDPALGLACSVTEEVTVSDLTHPLYAFKDTFQTNYEVPVSGYVLRNDFGFELRVTAVDSVHGGAVVYSENGAFTFTPGNGFSGEAYFYYTVTDKCGTSVRVRVTIEVLPEGCDYTVQFTEKLASCGWPDGSLTVMVNEPGQYEYAWSNGAIGPILSGVRAGTYTVTITDVDINCSLEFTSEVGELPAMYFRRLQVVQPECPDPGDIRFEVVTPGPGPILMELFHPNGLGYYEIEPGLTFLSDYVTIVEGEYKVVLTDVIIGEVCRSEFTVSIQPMETVELELEAVLPASGPTAMDGAILAFISDPGQAPHSIFLDGSFYGMTGTIEVFIEGVGVGDHSVYVVDANGCESNVLIVTVPFQESQWSLAAGVNNQSSAMQTVEHPVAFSDRIGRLHYEIMVRKQLFHSPVFVQGGIMGDRNGVYPNINLFGEWPLHNSKFFGFKCRTGIHGRYSIDNRRSHSMERFDGGLFIAPVASLNVMKAASIELSLPLHYYLGQNSRVLTTGFTLIYRVGINPIRSINSVNIERHFQ